MSKIFRTVPKVIRPLYPQIPPSKTAQSRQKHRYTDCNVYKDKLCKAINAEELKELQKKKEQCAKKESFFESIFGKKIKRKKCPTLQNIQRFEDVSAFVEKMKIKEAKLSKSDGHAYMLEMPFRFGCQRVLSKEEKLLHKIEKKRKNEFVDICDPIPPFDNVGQRMIELQKRGLHPLYRKYEEPYSSKITQFNYECPFRRLSAANLKKVDSENVEDVKKDGEGEKNGKTDGKLKSNKAEESDKGSKILATPRKYSLQEKMYYIDYKQYFLPKHISDRLNQIEIDLRSPLEFLKKAGALKNQTKPSPKPKGCPCK